jgi:peptidoglycan/LPS O-acetylase OafA/YrhL
MQIKGGLELKNRIDQLDSIRGLASFAVLLNHLYLVLPMLPLLFRYSPLKVIVNGNASVIMFFVLSGFVLFLPFMRGVAGTYRAFVIKRIFRIYIPYLASIVLAVLMFSLLAGGSIPGIDAWQSGISVKLLLEHLSLIFNTDTKAFNNVIWSLVHEMRISLFFPLIALCVMQLNWKMILFICLLLSLPNGLKDLFSMGYGYTTILDTMHYTSMFLIGALLAKNLETLIAIYQQWSRNRKWLILSAAFLPYAYSSAIITIVLKLGLPYSIVLSDYAVTLASGIFIIYAIGSIKLSSVLLKKPMIFLGRISYSLYLIHLIVLFSFMYLFYGTIPNEWIYLITVFVSLLLATLSWRFIEIPSIALGKKLTKVEKTELFSQQNLPALNNLKGR